MWDLLTLKDALNKKEEDELRREKQHQEKLSLRKCYIEQMRDQELVRNNQFEKDVI